MKNKKYILTIDQGTTSTRTIIFDQKGNSIAMSQLEFSQICPHSGWVEHNPHEIWETVHQTMIQAINKANISYDNISGIGITNQRETTIIWDKITGEPVYNAIVWQSRQSQDICKRWLDLGYSDIVTSKTGLIINPYFSSSKIVWILENVPNVREKAERGEVLFGTIDSYLVWKLTSGKVHVTDYTNASRTMLFNIKTLEWDEELLKMFGIPKQILPTVVSNSGVCGYANCFKNQLIPIASLIGDQQASLFGHCCFDEGDTKSTYGTGCFILMNTKDELILSKKGLLTTIAWGIDGHVEYALEGSVFVAGSAVQWLRDGLRFFVKSSDCEKYVHEEGSNGVFVVPAFVGLGTPYWDNDARGAVFGLTRASSKENFVCATLESIAYQAKEVMDVMSEEANNKIEYLGVDGGASVNDYLMQFQADLLNVTLIRPKCRETTALGAAYLAGLATGIFESQKEIDKLHQVEQIFMSHMNEKERHDRLTKWKLAVEATRIFK